MSYSYDRRASGSLDAVLHKGAEADEAATKTYLSLQSLKFGFDQMEEIPKDLQPIYDEIGRATSAVVAAQKHTYQIRMMVRKLANRR